jgi:hypothetical protein
MDRSGLQRQSSAVMAKISFNGFGVPDRFSMSTVVTPGFKEQIRMHLICAPRKNNTHNNRVHRDKCHKYHKYTYYIAEDLQK